MIPDLTRTELAARLRSSIEGKEAWDYVATNVGLVASAVKFLAPSAGIADAMIADARRQLAANPSDGPSDDKILDALVEALDVDRSGAMKLILRVAGANLDEREAV